MVIDLIESEKRSQHERYVQKLRESETEEEYCKASIPQASLDERIERLYAGLNVSHTRQDIDDFALIDWEEEEDWLDP